MLRKCNIAWRISILVVIGMVCILGSIMGYSYFTARHLLKVEMRSVSRYMALAIVNKIEMTERDVEKVSTGVAVALDQSPNLDGEGIRKLIEETIMRNPEVYGIGVARDPLFLGGEKKNIAPYVCRRKGVLHYRDLGKGDYNYAAWDWYSKPKNLRRSVWSEPYFGKGGNTLMVTYSVPVFVGENNNKFWGVIACDVSLNWLNKLMTSLPLGETGYAFLVSRKGVYITHPNRNFIMKETVFNVAKKSHQPALAKVSQNMVNGKSGFVRMKSVITEKPSWCIYAPIPSSGWSLSIILTEEELMQNIIRLGRMEAAAGAAGFVLLLLIALLISRSITQPIRALDKATRSLAKGNLDAPLPVMDGEDEVAHLADSFETMRKDLKDYLEKLRQATAEKERIESEIHIARSIQMSLLPKRVPQSREFDLCAMLEPARQVGGDLYDCFMIDDQNICLVIADAAGKGVPAALFMAVTRTYLKALSWEAHSPAETLFRLNNELAHGNDGCMFVTLFYAVIHLATGECRYASAGHNSPFIMQSDGKVTLVPRSKGAILGAVKGLPYEEGMFTMQSGEMLYLYTDGITEAMNSAGELYGEGRAIEELKACKEMTCQETLDTMRASVEQFVDGAAQSDDITQLAFRYMGRDDYASVEERLSASLPKYDLQSVK